MRNLFGFLGRIFFSITPVRNQVFVRAAFVSVQIQCLGPGYMKRDGSNPDTSKPDGAAFSQNGTGSEGKEATDEVPTTGDAAPISGLSLLAVVRRERS